MTAVLLDARPMWLLTDDVAQTQAGTKATKYKARLKSELDRSAADSACRGPGQVLACSVLGVALQLAYGYYYGEERAIGEWRRRRGRSQNPRRVVSHL